MFRYFKFNEFKPPERAFVLSASALTLKRGRGRRGERWYDYHKRSLEAIEKGEIVAVFIPHELAKLKKYMGEEPYNEIYSPVWNSKSSRVFCIGNELSLYERQPYKSLYRVHLNHGIHMGDLLTATVAMEYRLPLITDDPHHWNLRSTLCKAFRERYRKRRGPNIFEMYTSQDFVKIILKP